MYDIEKISNKLASKISSYLCYDQDYEEVLAYGAFSILQTLNTILYIFLFGFLFKVPLEAFLISFAASILRKYSGGVHASTPNRCAILGVSAFVSIALAVKYFIRFRLEIIVSILVICFGIAYFIIFKNAPMDSPNKPLTDPEVKRNLKLKSQRTLHVFLLITIALMSLYTLNNYNYGLNIVLSISFGALWQSLTMTYIGNLVMSTLDKLLGKITLGIGGGKNEQKSN